jgi:hypothetical protein
MWFSMWFQRLADVYNWRIEVIGGDTPLYKTRAYFRVSFMDGVFLFFLVETVNIWFYRSHSCDLPSRSDLYSGYVPRFAR